MNFIGKTPDKALTVMSVMSELEELYIVLTVMSVMSELEEIMKLRRENKDLHFPAF